MKAGEVSFVFVIEGARLQVQSLILADSLRRHHPEAELVAYFPNEGLADLPEEIAAVLQACQVSCRPIALPRRHWRKPYPHGNKILALAAPRDSRFSVFLDTDMAVVAPINEADLPGPMQVSVVPEGVASWGKTLERWQVAYGVFDLPLPQERIHLLRGRKREFPPFFNAGMVAIREEDRVDGKSFGALWSETASIFDHKAPVGNKRPWLDQITLPITMKRFGFGYKIVDQRMNCPISNSRDLEGLSPSILHYHRSRFLRDWPGHEALIESALDRAPQHRTRLQQCMTESGFLGDLPEAEAGGKQANGA